MPTLSSGPQPSQESGRCAIIWPQDWSLAHQCHYLGVIPAFENRDLAKVAGRLAAG